MDLVASTRREPSSEVVKVIRERSFRRRGNEVRLRELTDLIALRIPDSESKSSAAPATQDEPEIRPLSRRDGVLNSARLKSHVLDAIAPEVLLPEVRAFEDAGWLFVPSSEVGATDAAARAKVFVNPEGRLALITNKLHLQLQDDPSKQQANEILHPYGCRVLEKLSFAPGLFRVEVADESRKDALDVANELVASGVCKFAEPELIEALSGR